LQAYLVVAHVAFDFSFRGKGSYRVDDKLGQGRDAAKQCIQDNPELADELEKLIFDALKDKE
jgi:hypothetical protein